MKLKEIKTISKFYLFLSSIVVLSGLSVLSMVGCKKTEGAVNSEDEIKISVDGMPNTKTEYSRTDSLQLIWVTGVQISIFCDQAGGDSGKQKADYNVTPKADSTKGTLSIADADSTGLRWGNDDEHNLYAVYPSIDSSRNNVIKVTDEEGVFTFKFPKRQECSVAGGYSPDNNKNKYMLKPNMYLAYMVAKQEGLKPTGSTVQLSFKPIATTLEITLQGATNGDINISGMEINVKSLSGNFVKDNDTKDTCQIQFTAKGSDFYSDVSNALTAYPSGGVTTATFNIGLSDNEGSYTLESGKSVTFTVFLPPIKNLDDVEVKCLDANGNSLGKKQILTTEKFASPASKSFFTLPKFNNLVVTIDNESITYPETAQATAIMYYSDGTSEDVTSSCTWDSGTTLPIVDATGKVMAFGTGTKTITATYTKNDVTYKATKNINIGTYRTFVRSDYIQWNSSSPAYSESDMAIHLKKSNVSFGDDNGPAYTFSGSDFGSSNGTVLTVGRWILKMGKTEGTATTLAQARTNGDYIFLPACGYFNSSGSFGNGGTYGNYWLSTPNPSLIYYAYYLDFGSGSAYVDYNHIFHYMVPMPKLVDDYLEVTIDNESITYPETAQATATIYYSDGTNEVVTSSCTWDSGTTDPIVDATGKVWAFGTGTKTIIATYTKNNVTYKATKNINIGTYRTFVRGDYIQWNSTSPAYSESEMSAHLAKSGTVSFWDDNGPAYTFSGSEFGSSNDGIDYNGKVCTAGRWFLKMGKTAGTATTLAQARTNGDYIFLPATGEFINSSGSFYNGGTYGHYWLGTPNPSSTNLAYDLNFNSGNTNVGYGSTSNYMVPMPKLGDNNLEITIDNESITYPETAQATATIYYSDGTNEVVTSSCTWDSGTTDPIVDATGKVWAFGTGTKTITATYTKNDVTYKATKNINIGTYKTYERGDYIQWNSTSPAYSQSDIKTHLAKSGTVSFWDAEGPAYTFSGSDFGTSYNGVVFTAGRWILKMDKTAGTATTLAQARTNGDYIFLPACGYFRSSGSFYNGGTYAHYWLGTPYSSNANNAYDLNFNSGITDVGYGSTNDYLVPIPKLE